MTDDPRAARAQLEQELATCAPLVLTAMQAVQIATLIQIALRDPHIRPVTYEAGAQLLDDLHHYFARSPTVLAALDEEGR